MKIRIIYDNIDKCYYTQFKKWWYIEWQYFCEQSNDRSISLKFHTIQDAEDWLNSYEASCRERRAREIAYEEEKRNRVKVYRTRRTDVPAPEYCRNNIWDI